jgi:hypothetical protein
MVEKPRTLVDQLDVKLADLFPRKGVAVSLAGEPIPYRISERLHAAIKHEATVRGVSMGVLLRSLRDELDNTD